MKNSIKRALFVLQIAVIVFAAGFLAGYDRGHDVGGVIIETPAEWNDEWMPLIEDEYWGEVPLPEDAITGEEITDEEIDKLLENFLGEGKKEPFHIEDYGNWDHLIEAKLSKEAQCLAKNIYFEARDRQAGGRLAVAMVSVYRVESKRYPNTMCNVVWEKHKNRKGKMVAQFSWTLDGLSDRPVEKSAWKKAKAAALWVMAYKDTLIKYNYLDGATHYHANYVDPPWNWNKLTLVRQMEVHKFYRTTVAKN